MEPKTRRSRQHRGQAIVLIALMAVALVSFVGLALDGAQVFENRRWMQNGADAGAFAGATELGGGGTRAAIESKINAYTVGSGGIGNNADAWEAAFLPSGNNVKTTSPAAADDCVRVTTYVTFPTYFVGIVGFDSLNTSAQAMACSGYVIQQSGPGLRPLAVMSTTFNLDTEYCMFNSLPENQDPPADCTGAGLNGNFGWVAMEEHDGGSEVIDNLVSGFGGNYHYWTQSDCTGGPNDAPILPVPSCLGLRTGDIASARQELEDLRDNGTVFVVPLWDYQVDGGGSDDYIHIVAFAKFKITAVVMTGNPKYIKGKFVSFVEFGEICSPGTPGCAGTEITKKAVQLFR